jgi:hypothetical protein
MLGYFWQYHGLGYVGILLAISWPRIFWTSMVQGYKRRKYGEQLFSRSTPIDGSIKLVCLVILHFFVAGP